MDKKKIIEVFISEFISQLVWCIHRRIIEYIDERDDFEKLLSDHIEDNKIVQSIIDGIIDMDDEEGVSKLLQDNLSQDILEGLFNTYCKEDLNDEYESHAWESGHGQAWLYAINLITKGNKYG